MLDEIQKRRTFAIISHPDAGKTTLTEKLLLFGGAIRLAGTVKGRKSSRYATSDWMEIEKQRGISVTSSVLQFEYNGYKINILDTPGHQDFSEDTYRTLTAADSAVMLIDSAKGVEEQTKKLFKVCRMRGIPIFTFINKLDRHGRDPFDLMQEIEQLLGISSYPMNWPIGSGSQFRGVYVRRKNRLELYNHNNPENIEFQNVGGYDDPFLREIADDYLYEQLQEQLQLLDVAGDEFDLKKVQRGDMSPIFFGSAVKNFGIQSFLDNFLHLAPPPCPRNSKQGTIEPTYEKLTGYIFKIQANMNPAHRDRIAFFRICSGKFIRGMTVKHVRLGKEMKLTQPQQFLAQERDIVEDAYPGDIVGLYDPGIFRVGDSLVQGQDIEFDELPTFSPELFCKVSVRNALKHKSFTKGINQLTEEGTIQIFHSANGSDELILGVVGQLQLEVMEYRMREEYGVDILLQHLPYKIARWVVMDAIDPLKFRLNSLLVKDKKERYVALFENKFFMRATMEKLPDTKFLETAP